MTLSWLVALAGAAGLGLLAISAVWHDRATSPGTRLAATAAGWLALLAALALFDLSIPQLVNSYVWQIIIKVGIYVTLAVSLNIINGIAGQFSMGHAGFMAVGAYTAAYLTMSLGAGTEGWARWLPWNGPWAAFAGSESLKSLPWGFGTGLVFLLALLIGGLAAAAAGYLVGIPSLRLRGDYLAIVTLGFGEIIRNLIANVNIIGASRGLPAVPHYSNLFWVFLFAALSIFVSYRLLASAPGRAMLAVREDEIAAAAMGIDTTRTKIQAFAIGTFFAGIAGGLLGHHFEYLHPDYFKFDKSFEVIIMVVLGGMGSVSGAAVAAVVIAIAPEALRYAKDLLGNLTEPAVLYGAAPFILFALIFLALFAADAVRLLVRGTVRLVSAVKMLSRRAPQHREIVRLRQGAGRRAVSLVPAMLNGRPWLRDAGLGAVAGLFAAILHRALLGSAVDPRAEYWTLTLAGLAAGASIGARARRRKRPGPAHLVPAPFPHEPGSPGAAAGVPEAPGAASRDREARGEHGPLRSGRGAPPLAYRRLAFLGLLAPLAFAVGHLLESGAPDFLDRMSVFFRSFPDPRMVLYSIMLVTLMLTRPTGLFGTSEIRSWWRQRRAAAAGTAARTSG